MKLNCPKCGETITIENKSAKTQKSKYGSDHFRNIAKKSVEARRAKYGESLGLEKARAKIGTK